MLLRQLSAMNAANEPLGKARRKKRSQPTRFDVYTKGDVAPAEERSSQ